MTAAAPAVAVPVLAASVAVVRGDTVLLARRGRAPSLGLYSLPGGRVEAGESLADAALRELREEVAVEARIVGFNRHVEVIERDGRGGIRLHVVVASFTALWLAGEGRSSEEATAVIWATAAEAAALPVTTGLLPVIEAALVMARAAEAPR